MPYRILVADDEPDVPDLIRMMFRSRIKAGEVAFEFAENGEKALEKLAADPSIDLLFTDINMPVMDGLTLLNKLKENDFQQKAVVISAYGDLKNIRTAMNRGAFDFVTKPIDREDLEVTLQKAANEMEILRQGIEARKNLDSALIAKAEAQQRALEALEEKEKLVRYQNELLEMQVKERTMEVLLQKDIIEAKNTEIIDSINYAKRLQEAVLPSTERVNSLFQQNFVLYIPKDIVAGDFYWLHSDEKYIWTAIADCTGHGVAGALMSMLGVSFLNQSVSIKKLELPSDILNNLNDEIVHALRQETTDGNEGMDIILIRVDLKEMTMDFAGANRPLWLVRNKELLEFKTNKIPIGGLSETGKEFSLMTVKLLPGDVVYLSTDGYADQFGGEHGKKLMTKKLKEMLCEISGLPMAEQGKSLEIYLRNWQGKNEQVDDILIAGIKF